VFRSGLSMVTAIVHMVYIEKVYRAGIASWQCFNRSWVSNTSGGQKQLVPIEAGGHLLEVLRYSITY